MRHFVVITSVFLFSFCFSINSAFAYEKVYYYNDTPEARKSLEKNIDKIDIFAPQTYGINKYLVPLGKIPEDVKRLVAARGIKIMPLITNGNFSQDLIHRLLISPAAQDNVIRFLAEEGKANNYYGWQFDIEHIKAEDRDLFSAFVERTYPVLKQNNLVFSIAVVVRTDNSTTSDAYKNWSGAFDYARIASSSDFLSIMTYDDPESKGPAASLPFVTKALSYILGTGVPPEKISLGIPAYYWSWTMTSDPKRIRTGSHDRLETIRSRVHYTEGFNDLLGVPWLSFRERGANYIVWFENKKSFEQKTALIERNKLKGFSMWVLGMEDPAIWN